MILFDWNLEEFSNDQINNRTIELPRKNQPEPFAKFCQTNSDYTHFVSGNNLK